MVKFAIWPKVQVASRAKRASLAIGEMGLFLSEAFGMGEERMKGHAQGHNKARHAI